MDQNTEQESVGTGAQTAEPIADKAPKSRAKKAERTSGEVAPKKAAREGEATPASLAAAGRVKIILEENDEIPPSGQFVGVNGVGYLLIPGEPIEVPQGVVDVLDNAVRDKPRVEDGRVVGYRKALRFPYRLAK